MKHLIYIQSPSYSGSTLLTFLIGRHPEIATVGELKATPDSIGDVDQYVCSCGTKLKQCEFWKHLKKRLESKESTFSFSNFGTHFNSNSLIFRKLIRSSVHNSFYQILGKAMLNSNPIYKRRLENIIAHNRNIMNIVCEYQNAEFFLDGSKDPERLYHFGQLMDIDMKVINLHRDGRGFVNSYKKHYNTTVRIATEQWVQINLECRRSLRSTEKSRILDVHYESLCANPAKELLAIFEFIGVSDPKSTHFRKTTDLHILGNSMRLNFSDDIKHDEKWRRELTSSELEEFHSIDKGLNLSLGYN